MTKYLWVNPVAEKMYGEDINYIKDKLTEKGYVLVSCDSQMDYVKNQYKEYYKGAKNTILDCRCPETIGLLKRKGLISGFDVPGIEPILVRTARVLYEKYVKRREDTLIITCPCTQLRDFSKERLSDKKGVEVYTWKEFAYNIYIESLGKIEESPIPLGFFRDSFENVIEISDEEEIIENIKIIKGDLREKYDIVEMLYCKNGCNNGDGL